MFRVNADQLATMSESTEEQFVRRLQRHLEKTCPSTSLPLEAEQRRDYTKERIAAARALGLTWQSTIGEHARLYTLRQLDRDIVNPDRLAGSTPEVADSHFSEAMRRAKIINKIGA